ncbi:MAG TPA: hypothetical protein VKQ72_21435 [Aggregatilineales bacterium]|nr:hypothetical protein [Aggregatilineales bacterium]
MPSLIDKLNVMVRAGVNEFLNGSGEPGKVSSQRLGKDIHREVAALRTRIEEALNEEDTQQQRLDDLSKEIAQLDRQTDESLGRGDDSNARFLAESYQRKQRQAAFWRAELEEHRRATSELIERVNMLDAMISEAQNERAQAGGLASEKSEEEQSENPGVVLANVLREARQRVEAMIAPSSPSGSSAPASRPNTGGTEDVHHIPVNIGTAGEISPKKVDEDLAERRSRLSKPD